MGNLGNTAGYGHIWESNIRIYVTVPKKENIETVRGLLEPFIYQYMQSIRGSANAVLGAGLMKPSKLQYFKSNEMIDYMQRIKKVFDPEGILNPYKVIPN